MATKAVWCFSLRYANNLHFSPWLVATIQPYSQIKTLIRLIPLQIDWKHSKVGWVIASHSLAIIEYHHSFHSNKMKIWGDMDLLFWFIACRFCGIADSSSKKGPKICRKYHNCRKRFSASFGYLVTQFFRNLPFWGLDFSFLKKSKTKFFRNFTMKKYYHKSVRFQMTKSFQKIIFMKNYKSLISSVMTLGFVCVKLRNPGLFL